MRLGILKSFIEVSKKLNFKQDEFSANEMLDVQINFLTYGYNDEIDLINKLVINLNKRNLETASNQLTELSNLVRSRLRKELGLPKIN